MSKKALTKHNKKQLSYCTTSSNQFNQIEHTSLFNALTTMGIQPFTRSFHQSVALEWVHLLHTLHELKMERESCNDDDGADDQNTST